MAGKKISKDMDFAAGFFSSSVSKSSDGVAASIAAPSNSDTSNNKNAVKKHPGGRPRKEGLKNIQVCLTTPPELYEKVRILSEKYTSGNFSRFLIEECLNSFCRENNISLEDISIPDGIIDMYQNRQSKKK